MRLLLIGTSNSMMTRGFSEGLSNHPKVEALENRSLGASSSIHIARSISGIDFSDYNLCLLEFAVNEDILLRSGATSRELVESNLRHAIALALENKCLPVIVIFPRQPDRGTNAAVPFYLDLAQRFQLPWLDGFLILDHLEKKLGLPRESLFESTNHVTPEVGQLLGEILIRELEEVVRQNIIIENTAEWKWRALYNLFLAEIPDLMLQIRNRRNSRFNENFVSMTLGQKITLELSNLDLGMVTGVCVNVGQSSGFLMIEGENMECLDLRNKYREIKRRGLTISMLPLPSVVIPKDGCITLRCVEEDPSGGFASEATSEFLPLPTRSSPAEVEISRLIGFTSTEFRCSKLPAEGTAKNLSRPEAHPEIIEKFLHTYRMASENTSQESNSS